MAIRWVMLGDIVGTPGVRAVEQLMGAIRRRWQPDVVIANAENAYNGSGLTPSIYQTLRQAGVDAMTLGDHVYKRVQIARVLESQPDIIRPANISRQAKGQTWMKVPIAGANGSIKAPRTHIYVLTVLGRIFTTMPADDPFETVEMILGRLPQVDPIVLVEIHAEATSEKQAMGHFLDGKVSAVIGSHTHVPTADACILPRGTAYLTDLGMCGPHMSIIGRRIDRVLTHMTTAMPAAFDVAQGDPRINGVFIEIDEASRKAVKIERIELHADPHKPPFVNDPA